ncbi:MAG: hypothetical protein EOO43_17690 [Flavobacterium sp.]|nr:MAG: hypothetical protein EOO43_17690 [Flavobacterium sp.]
MTTFKDTLIRYKRYEDLCQVKICNTDDTPLTRMQVESYILRMINMPRPYKLVKMWLKTITGCELVFSGDEWIHVVKLLDVNLQTKDILIDWKEN